MHDEDAQGLSSLNRNYIVGLVFFALLVFGPVEPYGLEVRMVYLITGPAVLWLALWCGGRLLDWDACANDRINRAITASLAGMLVVGAYLSFTAEYHAECTQYAPDGHGGKDCVGETVTVPGPDTGNAFMFILFAGVAFWVAVARPSD